MSQLNITQDVVPPGAHIYQYALVDVPGVVAANVYLSHFNPVGSGKTIFPLGLVVQSYATTVTSSTSSLTLYRTSSDTGGTLISASSITRWFPGVDPNPVSTIRVGGPTVVTTGLALIGFAPVNSSGGGATPAALVAPFDIPPAVFSGSGLSMQTASGATSQVWDIQYTWMEL